jgi:site-specific DNA-methyltransferase (adenine-specific)
MRAKWHHAHGVTNVWSEPPVHGIERLKADSSKSAVAHANQKPLKLMERQILASTDPGNVIWEPFGGLCSATVAALGLRRRAFAAEINPDYFGLASSRVEDALTNLSSARPGVAA